jgi:hypothetical protein
VRVILHAQAHAWLHAGILDPKHLLGVSVGAATLLRLITKPRLVVNREQSWRSISNRSGPKAAAPDCVTGGSDLLQPELPVVAVSVSIYGLDQSMPGPVPGKIHRFPPKGRETISANGAEDLTGWSTVEIWRFVTVNQGNL